MTKEFNDAGEFVEFLKENETIVSILPFAEELMSLHAGIGKGCACRKNQRTDTRDHVYKTMIENTISNNKDLQNSLKKYSGATAIVWLGPVKVGADNSTVLLSI